MLKTLLEVSSCQSVVQCGRCERLSARVRHEREEKRPKALPLPWLVSRRRSERIVRNVLGGEDNALGQQHNAVVLGSGLLALD